MIQIEICSQFAVDALQQIQIEFRSHACAIVVSGFQHLPVLLQIDADEEPAASVADIRDRRKTARLRPARNCR